MNIEEFNNAEAQLHVACQMLSLTGINFVPKEADDSHTTVVWDDKSQLLIGREFVLNDNKMQVFIDPIAFEMGIKCNGIETDRSALNGRTYMQTVEPWKRWLKEAGQVGEVDFKLHYKLPENALYRFKSFTRPSEDILSEWAELRTLANKALARLNENVGVRSDINIWPHHFDTGTYYVLNKTDGEADRSIGAGFAPADSMVPEPYFYIYAWRKDEKLDYADAPELEVGSWKTGNWEGAVLPVSALGKAPAENVKGFFTKTSKYLKNKLA